MQPGEGILWQSTGTGNYSIDTITKPERGTEVILFLKPTEEEFLDNFRLKNIVTKYSDHILFPILRVGSKPSTVIRSAARYGFGMFLSG